MNNCNITIYPNGENAPYKQLNEVNSDQLCELLDRCVSHKTLNDGVVMCYSCDSDVPIVSFHGPNTSKAEDDLLISYGVYSCLLSAAKALY